MSDLAFSNSTIAPTDYARQRILELEAAIRSGENDRTLLVEKIGQQARTIMEQRAEIASLRAALGLKVGEA